MLVSAPGPTSGTPHADQRVVAAAWLARSGLEEAIAETLTAKGHDLRRAWMASRLTVLRSWSAPSVAPRPDSPGPS